MAVGKFNRKSLKNLELAGKRVLLRADYNVPVEDGHITDDYRLKASVPTIDYILKQKPKALIIISHLGRPEGKPNPEFSLLPVARHLSNLLDKSISFATDCNGLAAKTAADKLPKGNILLLENLRFDPGEEANDKKFAESIVKAVGAEVFVQDGFAVVHRAHASTDAITKILPSAGGLLLQKEVETIESVMANPEHPFVAVIGGAKIADKIEVLKKLISCADSVAVGGAMANNFLKAEGYDIAASKHDEKDMALTRQILKLARSEELKRAFSFLLPVDVVVSKDPNGHKPTRIVDLASGSLADIEAYPKRPAKAAFSLAEDELIMDIGPISAGYFAGAIKLAKTVIWNGTMGVTEVKGIAGADRPFNHATDMIMKAMIGDSRKHPGKPFTLVGGGDTVGYVESQKLVEDFGFVSTGGGATLELLAGKKLPGVESLPNK